MKNRRIYKLLLCCVVTTSVILVVEYVNKMGPIWAQQYYDASFIPARTEDAEAFEYLLRNSCYNLIYSEGVYGTKPLARQRSIWAWMTRDRSFTQYSYGEYALLMHFSYMYAIQKRDRLLQELIQKKFDEGFREGGGIIERQDQVAYGNVAIDLYKATKDPFYKQFADKLYVRLDSLCQKEGLVLYREGTIEQHVDAIGLVCPFLFYYAETFNRPHAKEIGEKMCEEYIKWGTDDITGIPVQTYNIRNHIKLNHVNWGRGISWFLLGTLNYKSLDSVANTRTKTLEKTLLADSDHLYNQYYSQGNVPDMSATIPVIYYLQEKKLLNLTKEDIWHLFSLYCDEEGIVRYCSPSIVYPHEGVESTIKSLQSQAILLYMFTLCH